MIITHIYVFLSIFNILFKFKKNGFAVLVPRLNEGEIKSENYCTERNAFC